MFKEFCLVFTCVVVAPLWAQLASALPADRMAFANQLSKRGLYAEALKEYEAIRDDKTLPRDEIRFRLGEAYRNVGRSADALREYAELIKDHPQSRYVDYARLNRALLMTGESRERELLALDHKGASDQIRATALYWLGETFEGKKDMKGATDWYLKAAKVSSTNDVARLSRLRAASLLSASAEVADRRQAQGFYLDLAECGDPHLAAEAIFFAGMMSYREGRHSEATTLFRRLAKEYPDSPRTKECAIYAAWSNYLSGRYGEVLQIAARLRDEGNEDAYYLVGAALRRLERRQDAVDAYSLALAKFPRGRHADTEWFERLAVLAASGDNAAVLDELARRPDPPPKMADRAWSYGCEAAIAVTNYPRAIEFATLVARQPQGAMRVTAVHRLAWLYEKTEDWPRAALAYRTLSKNWPENPVAAQSLYQAGVAELRAGRPEQARADWTALLAKYPDSPFGSEALYSRAMEELRKKEFRAAEHSLDELQRRYPQHAKRAESLYWWGVAANGIGDAPEAERHFRAALEAKPSAEFEREARLELAFILQKRGAEREAAEMFAGLLGTKAEDRMPPRELEWLSETMGALANYAVALSAAKVIEKRNIDADWNQIGATLVGAAHEGLGETDAAIAAYSRALATGARTASGAKAALALGRLETTQALFDEAKAHLADAVARAQSEDLLAVRVQAYVALAANEEARGDGAAALGYHMLVGTLFDDPEVVPHALARAAAILRKQGRGKEADELDAERAKRYPKAEKKF
ncbi:MAG: tetratricopeptide repeat protein [Kiritimatiellia bacterium]